ncbi:MAG TPA: vanadium-dependent haloperoxidase [Cyclobacteriaceae bacterium]
MKTKMAQMLLFAALVVGCSTPVNEGWRAQAENPDFLHRTIREVTDIIIHDIFSPPVASRIYGYTSIAAYETAIKGNPKFRSLAGQVNELEPVPGPEGDEEYCLELSSVEAAIVVGRALVFSEDKMDEFHTQILNDYRATGMPEEVFDRSVAYGETVAKHILKWAGTDNYKQTRSFPKYTVVNDPATWKPTPPAYMDGVEPHWNKVRAFVLDSATQFMPDPPLPFSTDANSPFYKDAQEVYATGVGLSEEQREIARFWDCNPFVMNVKGHVMFATKKISPGGHWIAITELACKKTNKSVAESAEAYAMTSMALMDAFVSCWDEKYRSVLIRPETYINQYIDENWTPLLQTPPFPEYTSGHSMVSNAASVVLTKLFGDNFSFTDSTEVDFGITARSFNSFREAAAEATISRLYGGIHYRRACEVGAVIGTRIGEFVVDRVKTRDETLAHAAKKPD